MTRGAILSYDFSGPYIYVADIGVLFFYYGCGGVASAAMYSAIFNIYYHAPIVH